MVIGKSILSRSHPSEVSASCENPYCTGCVSDASSRDVRSRISFCNGASSGCISGVFLSGFVGIFTLSVLVLDSLGSVCVFCTQAQSDSSRTSASNSASICLGVVFIAAPFRIFRFGRNRRRRIRCNCFRCWKSCARSSGWRSSYG
jgi:hypothetical protein